jgi:hypothetical protein
MSGTPSDGPRPLVVRVFGWAVLAALLSAGASWALIGVAGSTTAFEERSLSVNALLDLSRRRLTVLRAAQSLPGFGKRARRASSDIFDAAAKALEGRAFSGQVVGQALLAMDPRQMSGSSGKRRLCQLGQLETLAEVDAREPERLNGAALGAAVLGLTHRSASLQERILGRGAKYSFLRSRIVGRLMAANYRERVVSALRRFIDQEKDSSTRGRLQELLCVQLALAGRDQDAAALPRSGRCQAVRAWQAALSGQHGRASRLVADRDAPSPVRGSLLLRLAIHAEAGRWTELATLYRESGRSTHQFGDPYAEPLKFFNDIYSPPLPISLTRRLLRRVEERIGAPGAAPLPAALLPRLLFVRARQQLLAGRPRRAQALLRRVRRIAPGYEKARLARIQLLELLDGPGPALAALREQKVSRPLQEATYLTMLGRHREAHTLIDAIPHCDGICAQLRVAVARALGDKATLEAQKRRVAPRGSSDLAGRLLSPPKGQLLRPWTLGNVSAGLRAKLVFLRLADPAGVKTRRWVRSSLCQLDQAPLDGTMLGIYILEEIARRDEDETALARLARWRRRVGLMYERAAELWLPNVPD